MQTPVPGQESPVRCGVWSRGAWLGSVAGSSAAPRRAPYPVGCNEFFFFLLRAKINNPRASLVKPPAPRAHMAPLAALLLLFFVFIYLTRLLQFILLCISQMQLLKGELPPLLRTHPELHLEFTWLPLWPQFSLLPPAGSRGHVQL